jgi:tetratricopeptide (TPR) repeat protein
MDGATEAVLSRALLAQRRLQEAQSAADRAIALSRQGGEFTVRFEAELAKAAAKAELGETSEAVKILQALHVETARYGYVGYQLQAELHLGELEFKSGNAAAARARLTQVQKDAEGHGFTFIARKAASALNGSAAHA